MTKEKRAELPLFNPKATCPKCAGVDIQSRHHDEQPYYCHTGYKPERMERRCQRCMFAWFERPLDAMTPEELLEAARAAQGEKP
jgi:hypothetical protein